MSKALYLQSNVQAAHAGLKLLPSLWYFVLLNQEHVLTGQRYLGRSFKTFETVLSV